MPQREAVACVRARSARAARARGAPRVRSWRLAPLHTAYVRARRPRCCALLSGDQARRRPGTRRRTWRPSNVTPAIGSTSTMAVSSRISRELSSSCMCCRISASGAACVAWTCAARRTGAVRAAARCGTARACATAERALRMSEPILACGAWLAEPRYLCIQQAAISAIDPIGVRWRRGQATGESESLEPTM